MTQATIAIRSANRCTDQLKSEPPRLMLTSYNPNVPTPLSRDTSPEVERLQVERWRTMSTEEKAALISGLTRAAYELAEAGVRSRHPDASPRERFLRLALVTLGPDLANRAYPDIATLRLP